jgi:hypothetical protein
MKYHLSVKIDGKDLRKQLLANKINLCCAFEFRTGSGKSQYNTVAWADCELQTSPSIG